MKHDITIEPLMESHIAAVQAIECELFPSPWTKEMFRQEIEDNHLAQPLVALLDGEVIGYVIAWFLREKVHLLNIAIAPAHQQKGYGHRLLTHLIQQARSAQRDLVTLEVRVGNTAARTLYQSHGFRDVVLRPNYYPETGEDAVVMALDLNGDPPGAPE